MSTGGTVSSGRLPDGRFAPGNGLSAGNPRARRMYRVCKRLLKAVTPLVLRVVPPRRECDRPSGPASAIASRRPPLRFAPRPGPLPEGEGASFPHMRGCCETQRHRLRS